MQNKVSAKDLDNFGECFYAAALWKAVTGLYGSGLGEGNLWKVTALSLAQGRRCMCVVLLGRRG